MFFARNPKGLRGSRSVPPALGEAGSPITGSGDRHDHLAQLSNQPLHSA